MKFHPIQLKSITVSRLNIVINDQKLASDFEGEINFRMQRGISEFEEGNPHIAVGLRIEVRPVSEKDGQSPFEIDVELAGQFDVDYDEFDFGDLERWSEVNAPLLLFPYVREQVYGLALRAGVKGMMLPLIISQPARKSSTEKTE